MQETTQGAFIDRPDSTIPWLWFGAIALISSLFGWNIASYSPLLSIAFVLGIYMSIAIIRACYRGGFATTAGLFAFSFSMAFIWVGALTSAGAAGWAINLLLVAAGIFTLDIALEKAAIALKKSAPNFDNGFSMASAIALAGVLLGWIVHGFAV